MFLYTRYILIFVILFFTSSCFTEIENTKKITEKDVEKVLQSQKSLSTQESKYNHIAIDSFPKWENGRKFFVVDNNVRRIFSVSTKYDIDSLNLAGCQLEYIGFEENSVLDNRPKVELNFTDGVYVYKYSTGKTLSEIRNKKIMLTIPFMVDLAIVDKYKREISNKDFYIRTSIWYDEKGNMIQGKKFVKVKLTNVYPGDKVFPLKVSFVTNEGRVAYVFMSTKQSSVQNRLFDNLFTEEDIRISYPLISNENWEHIVNGNVALEMTKDECRLALGNPNNIQERPTYDGLQEYWFYGDGMYLMFFDGLLKQYRK